MIAAARLVLALVLAPTGEALAQQALARPTPSAATTPGMMVPLRRSNPLSGVQGNRTFLSQPNLPGVSAPRVSVGRVNFAPSLESMTLPQTLIPQNVPGESSSALPELGSSGVYELPARDIPVEAPAGLADPLVEGVPESPQSAVGRYVSVKTRQLSKPLDSIRKLKNGRTESASGLGQNIMDSILGQEGFKAQDDAFLAAPRGEETDLVLGMAEQRETQVEIRKALLAPEAPSVGDEQSSHGAAGKTVGVSLSRAQIGHASVPGVALLTLEVAGQRLIFGTKTGLEQHRMTGMSGLPLRSRSAVSSLHEVHGPLSAAARREQDQAFVFSALGFRELLEGQTHRAPVRVPAIPASAWSRGFDGRRLPTSGGELVLAPSVFDLEPGARSSGLPESAALAWLAALLLAAELRRRSA